MFGCKATSDAEALDMAEHNVDQYVEAFREQYEEG